MQMAHHRRASNFLTDILLGGPVSVRTIHERSKVYRFSEHQLDRAKRKLGVVAFKEPGTLNGGWYWALPEHRLEHKRVA
jgi:hypothetical protein